MKKIKNILPFFLLVLLIELIASYVFPEWKFRYRTLVYINIVLKVTSVFGIIICLLFLFIKNKTALALLTLLLLFICFIVCFFTIYPIDTYGWPRDIRCVKIEPNGRKTIVTEKISGKTNQPKHETIVVKDYWFVRKIYSSGCVTRTEKIKYLPNKSQYQLLDSSIVKIDTPTITLSYNKYDVLLSSHKPFGYILTIPFRKYNAKDFQFEFKILDVNFINHEISETSKVLELVSLKDHYYILLEQQSVTTGWKEPIITDTITITRIK